ncbi:MAG: SIR2-like domain [Solirubrobacterales bacterium]|jgi:hypothetical protein|nr:SIR2-like domain [Solirubrobacterales bacterium]
MRGLIDRLLEQMRETYIQDFGDHEGIKHLVNDVVNDKTDFEHLLTFLADTPSRSYQAFADQLRTVFSTVLRAALDKVRQELGDRHSELYAALVDMHQVANSGESLAGFLTLNYDSFLEHAIEDILGSDVDYGVQVQNNICDGDVIPVLKLHGSFSWRHTWPLAVTDMMESGLWIPPGIRKAKGDYPFNAIWGAARELLDCDVLRLIGCNLGPNDWDLVSLLFSTLHGRESAAPYEVEVIGWPDTASRIADAFPYLNVRSLLEIDEIGAQSIGEILGSPPTAFSELSEQDSIAAVENADSKIANPFEHWLRLKGELMLRDLTDIVTPGGLFARFVEASG